MKLGKKTTIFIFIALFIVGFFCGSYFKSFGSVRFKNELSVGEITNFILMLFIAIYIPFILNKKISNKRVEKDILINACNNLEQELHELRQLIESALVKEHIKKPDADKIILRTRNISNMLNIVVESTKQYHSNAQIKGIADKLITNQTNYWADLTLNLRDRVPKITEEVYIRTEKNLYEYLGNISKLRIYLNEA